MNGLMGQELPESPTLFSGVCKAFRSAAIMFLNEAFTEKGVIWQIFNNFWLKKNKVAEISGTNFNCIFFKFNYHHFVNYSQITHQMMSLPNLPHVTTTFTVLHSLTSEWHPSVLLQAISNHWSINSNCFCTLLYQMGEGESFSPTRLLFSPETLSPHI